MTQAVNRWPLTAEAQFRSQTSSREVFVGHGGTVTSISPSTSVFPVSIIPPMIHTDLHLHVAPTRSTNGRSLKIFQKGNLFRNRGALIRTEPSLNI